MKIKKKHLILIIIITIYLSPIDPSIYLNQALGWQGHWLLFMLMLGVIYYFMNGNGFSEKVNNVFKEIKKRF